MRGADGSTPASIRHDTVGWQTALLVSGHTYRAEPRSVAVLYANLECGCQRTAASSQSCWLPTKLF